MEEKVCPQGAEPDLTVEEQRGEEGGKPDEEQSISQEGPQVTGTEDAPNRVEGEIETGEGTTAQADRQEDEVAVLKQALEKQKEEKEEYLRFLQRTRADFENYRRRTQRERLDLINRANERLFLELLPVLDNLERALQVEGEPTAAAIIEGVEMIYRQFMEILKREGVTPIEAEGEPFNPKIHEAVLQVEACAAEAGTVVEEVQKGYMLHDRVLRPSLVKVAKG
ncbi:MAG: nucleotide exchange factor GrpE [bacterium]|jgi:molecular chaperone GrpE